MTGCIFCKIINGDLPCAKIFEDERVVSFLDINPIHVGHALVVPKRHYATLFEIPEDDLLACGAVFRRVAAAVYKATNASGLNLLQNNHRAAGQVIDHIHFHLIPRFRGDVFLGPWPGKPCPQQELDKMLDKIRAVL